MSLTTLVEKKKEDSAFFALVVFRFHSPLISLKYGESIIIMRKSTNKNIEYQETKLSSSSRRKEALGTLLKPVNTQTRYGRCTVEQIILVLQRLLCSSMHAAKYDND